MTQLLAATHNGNIISSEQMHSISGVAATCKLVSTILYKHRILIYNIIL